MDMVGGRASTAGSTTGARWQARGHAGSHQMGLADAEPAVPTTVPATRTTVAPAVVAHRMRNDMGFTSSRWIDLHDATAR